MRKDSFGRGAGGRFTAWSGTFISAAQAGQADLRMVSIALGRPLGVDDLDIDVGYPSEVDDDVLQKMAKESRDLTPDAEAHGSTMSGFVALTKLCKISGRVAHLLYRPSNKSVVDPHWAHSQQTNINKLDKSLRDWLANEVVCSTLVMYS
jgi:hypothetical protein